MSSVLNSITSCLMKMVVPRGKSKLHDKILLMLWEGYSFLRGIIAYFREGSLRKTSGPSNIKKKSTSTRIQYNGEFFRTHITEHILPFWEKYSIDYIYGGFINHLDRKGRIYDDTTKFSSMQGRMIYAFSVGYDIQSNLHYLEIVEQGFKFLVENFWDDKFGGWYRSVYRDGQVKDADKHLYDQSYVMIGLIEYYRVTRDKLAYEYITKTHEVLNQNGWDKQHFGYYNHCGRDWTKIWSQKTICSQLDQLTVIMLLYRVENQEILFQRLKQVADLIVSCMCDKKYHCLLQTFHRNWLYNPLASKDKIKFGHNLKGAWLLLEMYRLTKDSSYFECASRLLDYCIKYGWDNQNEGFYQHAFRNGILATSEKRWWPECAGIPALLLMNILTSDASYRDYFERLTDFSLTHFFDSGYGEWFTSCQADGAVKDERKGYDFKAAFHTVHACFYAYRYLEEADKRIDQLKLF